MYIEIIAVQSYSCKMMMYSINAFLFANAFKKENVLILSYCEYSTKDIVLHKHYQVDLRALRSVISLPPKSERISAPADGLIKKKLHFHRQNINEVCLLSVPFLVQDGCMTVVICSKLALVARGPLTKYVRTLLLLISLRQIKRQQRKRERERKRGGGGTKKFNLITPGAAVR